jgi:hypothetical protein
MKLRWQRLSRRVFFVFPDSLQFWTSHFLNPFFTFLWLRTSMHQWYSAYDLPLWVEKFIYGEREHDAQE